MGFRFRKSIKIAPGVKLNLNKKSASVSFGGKGAHYTVSSTGKKTASVGIPGTGMSYVTSTGGKTKKASQAPTTPKPVKEYSPRLYKVCGVLLLVLAALSLLLGLLTLTAGGWAFLCIGVPCLLLGVGAIKKSKA